MHILRLICLFILLVSCGTEINEPLGSSGPSAPSVKSVGLALFAIQSPDFDCDGLINATHNLDPFPISILVNSFGDSNACLGRLAMNGKLKTVQFHLTNGVCRRNGNCFDLIEVFSGDYFMYEMFILMQEGWLLDRIHQRTSQVLSVLELEEIECFVSTGLEDDISNEATNLLIDFLRPALPAQCKIVHNPVDARQPASQADYYEHHAGTFPTNTENCIASNDGTDLSVDGLKELINNSECEITFLWDSQLSNLYVTYQPFIFPHERPQIPIDRNNPAIQALQEYYN